MIIFKTGKCLQGNEFTFYKIHVKLHFKYLYKIKFFVEDMFALDQTPEYLRNVGMYKFFYPSVYTEAYIYIDS